MTTQYSSAKDTISAVKEKVRNIHRPFSGAQVRVAMLAAAPHRFLTGTLAFAGQKPECRPKACYRELHLSEFWIDGQDAAVAFLERLFNGGEPICSSPLPAFPHALAVHDSSGHTVSGWPSWVCTSTVHHEGQQNIYLDQSPAVSMGLEPFRSTADAVRRWVYGEANCDQMTNSVPNQEQFVTIVPDTRARFASGRWRVGRLELSIDAGVDPSELELQIIRLGSSERSSRHSVARGTMDIEMPEDATGLGLYLVHKSGDLIATRSLNAHYRAFGEIEEEGPELVDYALDLQSGENERREFKPFIEPRHPKEFEIVKTVVAFANTEGGTLFVGVNDEGIPQGQAEAHKCFRKANDPVKDQLQMLRRLITESTKPVPSVLYSIAEVNGYPVIVVEVSRANVVCAVHDNRVFVRRGATSRVADPHTELPSMVATHSLGPDSY